MISTEHNHQRLFAEIMMKVWHEKDIVCVCVYIYIYIYIYIYTFYTFYHYFFLTYSHSGQLFEFFFVKFFFIYSAFEE